MAVIIDVFLLTVSSLASTPRIISASSDRLSGQRLVIEESGRERESEMGHVDVMYLYTHFPQTYNNPLPSQETCVSLY